MESQRLKGLKKPKVPSAFLEALPQCFVLASDPITQPQTSRELPNPPQSRLQVANVILLLIPFALQMNSGGADHEIARCHLFAYILKNRAMFGRTCEEAGGENISVAYNS